MIIHWNYKSMENKNKITKITKTIKQNSKLALLFWGLVFANISSENLLKNNSIKYIYSKNSKNISIQKIIIDFSYCKNIKDIFWLLESNWCVVKINPSQYFEENHKLFEELKLDKDKFVDIYNKSDIVKYGIYTELLSSADLINALNSEYQKLQNNKYTEYIYLPENVEFQNLEESLQKLDIEIRPKQQDLSIKWKDISKKNYKEFEEDATTRLPRREVKKLFDDNHIKVWSSGRLYEEKWNNKSEHATCLHWLKKSTVDFIIQLSKNLKSEYNTNIMNYDPIVVTWGTENWHKDIKKIKSKNKKQQKLLDIAASKDHPGGSKFDLSTFGKRWVILGIYSAKLWIYEFSSWGNYINWYNNKYLPNWWYFAILIHPNKNCDGVHFDILVK